MSPTLQWSSAIQLFKCGNVIEICNGPIQCYLPTFQLFIHATNNNNSGHKNIPLLGVYTVLVLPLGLSPLTYSIVLLYCKQQKAEWGLGMRLSYNSGKLSREKTFAKYFHGESFQELLACATPPNFVEKTFANSHKNVKFAEVFSLESFPLYGIMSYSLTECSPSVPWQRTATFVSSADAFQSSSYQQWIRSCK